MAMALIVKLATALTDTTRPGFVSDPVWKEAGGGERRTICAARIAGIDLREGEPRP